MDTEIDVIVPNWNGRIHLSQCIEGLLRQSYGNISITMVDNGSDDDSVTFVNKRYPDVCVIELSENLGFAVAANFALRSTKAEYIALLNNDAVAGPFWLEHLANALKSYPEAGSAAGKMLFYGQPDMIDRAGDAYTIAGTGSLRGRGVEASTYGQTEWVFGACAGAVLYRTDMLRKIGLFDEDFFILYEDVDLSFRAQLQGYKCIYVPEAVVYHKGSATIVHDSPISVYYSHRNLEWVYLKNLPASLFITTLIPHMLYDLFAFIFFLIRGRVGEFLKAKIDALKGIGIMLEKRRNIQGNRKVSDRYIWDLLEPEFFLPRLTRRLSKTPRPRRSDK